MDLHQLVGWLFFVGLVVGLSLLSKPSVRNFLAPPMIRLGSWTLAQLRPRVDPDEEADDLSKVLRRQQLWATVQRLQRVLATDESMSATRQIANRIAYRQLLHELGTTPGAYDAMPSYATASRWNAPRPSTERSQRAPTVEILEIGRRRRRGNPPQQGW
jgi:hypothetical protein